MNVNTNGALMIAVIVAVGLFMLVGGGSMTARMGGGMVGPAWMNGAGGLWIPAVLTAALGGWLVWRVVRK